MLKLRDLVCLTCIRLDVAGKACIPCVVYCYTSVLSHRHNTFSVCWSPIRVDSNKHNDERKCYFLTVNPVLLLAGKMLLLKLCNSSRMILVRTRLYKKVVHIILPTCCYTMGAVTVTCNVNNHAADTVLLNITIIYYAVHIVMRVCCVWRTESIMTLHLSWKYTLRIVYKEQQPTEIFVMRVVGCLLFVGL
jgi:hypothetical protein